VKRLTYLLVGLAVGIGAVYFLLRQLLAHGDPGYVVIGMGHWSAETSLLVAIAVLVFTFFLFYLTIRLVVTTLSLPRLIKRRGQEKRNLRSQQALIDGLLESAEGNWESAEKHLIRHAANSGVPLINYLTAARAAHFRGALDQRDEYLKLAHESMPDAELAIGLTKAELQLSHQQFEEALENLTELEKIAPSHAAVLKLKHQAYSQAEDWEGIRRIIPQLHANKVMMEAEIKLLETETYSALLRQRAASHDAQGLRDLWKDMPAHIRKLAGIEQLYFAAMIESGAGAEIEPQLRQALSRDWGETLLVLYGCIALPDPRQQLAQAEESWLPSHRQDAILLRVLGKLAVRAEYTDKALQYLESSLGIEPSVEAYQLMGDLMLQQGDSARACEYFRNGLLFASNEAVAQVEQDRTGE